MVDIDRPAAVAGGPAPRLVLLPGLGADARMYVPLARHLPGIVVPPWLPPAADLPAYGRAYAAAGLVRPGDVVGGCSFGGFVALEAARAAGARAVLLLGSARDPAAYHALATLAPLARVLPDGALAWRTTTLAVGAVLGSLPAPWQRRLFAAILAARPPAFVRWCIAAGASWAGLADPGCPVRQLHGSGDLIMPLRRVRPDAVIAGAGHVLPLTHPRETAAFIAAALA